MSHMVHHNIPLAAKGPHAIFFPPKFLIWVGYGDIEDSPAAHAKYGGHRSNRSALNSGQFLRKYIWMFNHG